MEHIVSTNSLNKEFCTYVNIRIGKPQRLSVNGRVRHLYSQIRFWDKVKFLYRAERKVEFEVKQPTHTRKGDFILQISISLESYRPKNI